MPTARANTERMNTTMSTMKVLQPMTGLPFDLRRRRDSLSLSMTVTKVRLETLEEADMRERVVYDWSDIT